MKSKRCYEIHKNCNGSTCRWEKSGPKRRRKPRGKNPLTVRVARKGLKKFTRTVRAAVKRDGQAVKRVRDALKGARQVYRAPHPGKALPASLAGRKKRRQKNPVKVSRVNIGDMITIAQLGLVKLVRYCGAGTIEVVKGEKYYRVSGLNVRAAK